MNKNEWRSWFCMVLAHLQTSPVFSVALGGMALIFLYVGVNQHYDTPQDNHM